MSLSQLARSIRESATLKLNETAALLRDKGEPIIHLGGGEPKSKAPIDAVLNCAALLNTGEIRYTAPDGIPALKKAIVRYTEEHYKKIVSARNVIASGGRQAVADGAAARHSGSQGRGDFPRSLLGELSRDGEACGRSSGTRHGGGWDVFSNRERNSRRVRFLHQSRHFEQPQ